MATLVDEEVGDGVGGRFGAALLFVRWSEAGESAIGHLESGYVGTGPTPEAALELLRTLTLRQVQDHLEACIRAAREREP